MKIYRMKGGFAVSCNVDWNLIKAEYIAGGVSYRELAKKYDVPFSTLSRIAIKENWVELKRQVENKVETDLVNSTASTESSRLSRIDSIADKLLEKIERAVDELDLYIIKNTKKEKVIEYNNSKAPNKPTKEIIHEDEKVSAMTSIIDKRGLREISAALREIKDIKGIKSEQDIREQEARIANLEKQAQKDNTDESIEVVMDAFEEYSI